MFPLSRLHPVVERRALAWHCLCNGYHILLLWSNDWRWIVVDLRQLHPVEEILGGNVSGVLALRMLYSSVCSNSQLPYHSFLTGMDRRLLHSLEPLDVLYFWQQAGAIGAGTAWMAVFAVDEVCIPSTSGFQVHCCLPTFAFRPASHATRLPVCLLSDKLVVLVSVPSSKIASKSCVAISCMSMLSHSAQSAFKTSTLWVFVG